MSFAYVNTEQKSLCSGKPGKKILGEEQEFATKEKNKIEPGVVAHVCNHSSTQEAEAGWTAIGILWR